MYDGRNIFTNKMLELEIRNIIQDLYNIDDAEIQIQKTRKEFAGDITLVVFPLLRYSKKNLELTANEIGLRLKQEIDCIIDFNIVKGFLNIEIDDVFWFSKFLELYFEKEYGKVPVEKNSPVYLVEYSSPNTNKPIHLGHLRNNFLGHSVAEIIKASGKRVKKVQIINDRGIHICKSMVAWQDFGFGENPDSSGIKGDHLVGKYYVKFDQEYQKQINDLVANGLDLEDAKKQACIFQKAQDMLIKWERGDKNVRDLWKKMNGWVYNGFEETYNKLGITFDKNYYESETYLLGKEFVDAGLEKGVFYRKEDGSVWIDLSQEGMDEKIVLRSDGTAVYITQDIGTAVQRYRDFQLSNMIYVVANEQDYHFKVLFLILEKLGYKWAKNCFHLSYGMVDLPSGKMKSREGTVVDADELVQEMIDRAQNISNDLGKLDGMKKEDAVMLYEMIGLAALKYYILKVDPKKSMLFDPNESIDFNGNTGPFIQYTYARIQSLRRKYTGSVNNIEHVLIIEKEKDLIKKLIAFPSVIQDAANNYSPAIIANYVYELVKDYNNYYQSTSILNAENSKVVCFRLALSLKVGEVIKTSMHLLGLKVPSRM